MNWAAIVWLVLMVILILIETSTVSLVSIWFATGALIALVASLLGAQVWLQMALFFTASVVLLLLLRPMARKHFTPKLEKTNVDSLIGTTGVVTVTIDNVMATGTAKIGAMEWTARSTSGEVIEAGTLVTVDKVEGVKAFVTPVKVPETV